MSIQGWFPLGLTGLVSLQFSFIISPSWHLSQGYAKNIHKMNLIKCGHIERTEKSFEPWLWSVMCLELPCYSKWEMLLPLGKVWMWIQLQDPHPASKDPLESCRRFHTWVLRHNGRALACGWQCSSEAKLSFLLSTFTACWHMSTLINKRSHLHWSVWKRQEIHVRGQLICL